MVDMFFNGKCKKIWVIAVFILLFGGCLNNKDKGQDYHLEDYYRGDFVVTGEPKLDQEVKITFSIHPVLEAPNTTIRIDLPEEIELVQGDITWEGDVNPGEIVSVTITVKPVREGQLEIWAYVRSVFSSRREESYNYFLCFLTSKDKGQVSRKPFYHEPPPVETMGTKIPVGISLESNPQPNAGEEVVLTFSVLASEDTPNVKAEIVLPEEFIYISGTLEWTGDLKKDQKETFQVKIKTTVRGRFKILGIVTYNGTEDRFAKHIFVW
jgi:hypothetical protein